MDEKERKEYFEKLGVEPKRVEKHDNDKEDIQVIEGEREGKEDRKEKELEQYREVSTF